MPDDRPPNFVSELGGSTLARTVLIVGALYGVVEAGLAVFERRSLVVWLFHEVQEAPVPFLVTAGALVALVALWLLVRHGRRRAAQGLAHLNRSDDFVHLAGEILGAGLGKTVIPNNGQSAASTDAERMRNRILDFITQGGGKRRPLQCVYLVQKGSGSRGHRMLVPLFYEGPSKSQMEQFEAEVDGTIFGDALRLKKAQRTRSWRRDKRCPDVPLDVAIRPMICIPVKEPGDDFYSGVFCVMSKRRVRFTDVDEASFRMWVTVMLLLRIIDDAKPMAGDGAGPARDEVGADLGRLGATGPAENGLSEEDA